MSFGRQDEVYTGGAFYYDFGIIVPYSELICLTSMYYTDVLEPWMTIGFPIRYPKYDLVGTTKVH
jgi:hypothetical protein